MPAAGSATPLHPPPGPPLQVTNFLATGLNIKYGQVVASVVTTSTSTSPRTVTITTAAGVRYTAPYAVITVPLGVLKAGSITFSPALSAAKRTAITRVGFGVLDKVAMVFPSPPFWASSGLAFLINRIPPVGQERQWLEFFQLYSQARLPVMAAFNAGSQAVKVEAMSNAAILSEVGGMAHAGMHALRGCTEGNERSVSAVRQAAGKRCGRACVSPLPHTVSHCYTLPDKALLRRQCNRACPGSTSRHLPHPEPLPTHPTRPQVKAKLKEMFGAAYVEPTAAFINRWAADPLARGAYSYAALGSANPGTDRNALAAAEGRLLFAGEHTSRWYYGTVAGAYSSGRAAATKLLSCRRAGSAAC